MKKEEMIKLAQGQLEAYNKRDLEKFCEYYHPQVSVARLGEPEIICQGIETFKQLYKKRFDLNPGLNCQLKNRIVLKGAILDEEWVTGVTGASEPSHLVAIYHFKDHLISQVWFT
jgi:hypothetical protein